ncbi:MAG: sugar transferase [Candidatus Omnitrophota bacterium]
MLKEKDYFLRRLLVVADVALVGAAFFAGYFLISYFRNFFVSDSVGSLYPIHYYFNLIPVLMVLWIGSLSVMGIYRSFRGKDLTALCLDICKAGFLVTLLFSGSAYLFGLQYVSRVYITLVVMLSGIFLILEKVLLYEFILVLRRKGYNYRHILIVGSGTRAQNFVDIVNEHRDWGLRILGYVDDEPEKVGQEIQGYKVLGTLENLPAILAAHVVDEVVFVVPRSWMGKIEDAILYCEQLGKRVSVGMDYFNLKFAKSRMTDLGGFPLLSFETTSGQYGALLVKRFLDVAVSVTAMLVLSPLFLALMIMVKGTSKGGIFFKQERSGVNGRRFMLYKFRTMVEDAEERLEEIRKYNEMGGPAFKMTNDPRVTPIGKWMRKFSLDELPQFYNVMHGDMSIVGPRPPIPAEVEKYVPWQRRRLSMSPGLTCLWQVSGRNKIVDFDEWMKLDLRYIDQWSLWLDLGIFLKTVPVVLFAHGAK